MGIHDRDYMRRPAEDNSGSSSSDEQLEAAFGGFLRKHPRFFVYLGVGLGTLILIALAAAIFSGHGH